MAVEAVQALCGHLFAALPIDEIRAQTDARNDGSIRVAIGAGFVADREPVASRRCTAIPRATCLPQAPGLTPRCVDGAASLAGFAAPR